MTTPLMHKEPQRDPVIRPTEAQLRWSQFHHKQRARSVKEQVERLWQTPSLVSDVPNALSDDGRSSTDESAEESASNKLKAPTRRKKAKPKISRGRRALLRVSRRNYEARRADICQNGFQCRDEEVEEPQDEEEEDFMNALLFAAEDETATTKRKKRRRRRQTLHRRKTLAGSTEHNTEQERLSRFEAAYQAMMANLARPQSPQPLLVSSKRWTRPADAAAATIDGKSYDDLKWGIIQKQSPVHNNSQQTSLPFDRRASWLVHLPARQSSVRRRDAAGHNGIYESDEENHDVSADPFLFSPGQVKFDELVSALHQKEIENQHRREAEQQHRPKSSKKAALFRQRYAQRYGSSGENIEEPDDDDELPPTTDALQQPLSPASEAESEFWRTARQMDDTVRLNHHTTAETRRTSTGSRVIQVATFSEQGMAIEECDDEAGSDFWQVARHMQNEGGTPQKQAKHLASVPESKVTPLRDHSNAGSSFGFARQMGGMLHNVFSGKKEANDDEEEELRVFTAFRRMQNERKDQQGEDDHTSTSSFRLLPEGIRQAVKNFSGPKGVLDERQVQVELEEASYQKEGLPRMSESQQPTYHSKSSPSRSSPGRSGVEEYSPEHGILIHQKVMETSPLIGAGDTDQTIIDTDGASSIGSGTKMDPRVAASLFLSPTILTKRLKQAIRAIERQKWDQVTYLLSANPWLAEMADVTTEQYLLHKLALYGAGTPMVDPDTGEIKHTDAAPDQLNIDLIRMFPAGVHKFDQDGNLPLHMAAVSCNTKMVELVGERFVSGASVRNNDGLLPLHLAIQASSSDVVEGDVAGATCVIKKILKFFPGAIAVADNDGNLPIHCAAASLRCDVGVDVVYMLLDEADRQVRNAGLRFSENRAKFYDEDDSNSVSTDVTATPTDSSTAAHDSVLCNLVRNNMGHTPLMTAIRARAGWEMIEAITGGPGGRKAALEGDANKCNALHLLASEDLADPASILSIIKIAPTAACARNADGALPIEVASMHAMPREVILALVLNDLPVDLEEKAGVKIREGYGASWWFLTCECDDHHLPIVLDVLSLCSYPQVRELCFMKNPSQSDSGPVISRATPKCHSELRKALRFVGRFEFSGSTPVYAYPPKSLKVFEALDFGAEEDFSEEGRRVLLRCYGSESSYLEETAMLREHEFDPTFIEEVYDFAVHELDGPQQEGPQQFCVVVEQPTLTLDQVVAGMLNNEDYQTKTDVRTRYTSKVSMVLRLIAKCLRYLHNEGVVHGNVGLKTCGKFEDTWKLVDLLGLQRTGSALSPSRIGESCPPEALEMLRDIVETRSYESSSRRVTVKGRLPSHPSFDMWGFGKVAYEVLTGVPLIEVDPNKKLRDDNRAMLTILNWNEENLAAVVKNLTDAGISTLGADLITHCLLPKPEDRPSSIDEILEHPYWRDLRRKSTSNRSPTRRHHRHEI